MSPLDLLRLAWEALSAHRLRTRLTFAALAIGIASVLVLTALGEGVRSWIVDRFASIGSNALVAMPGRTETKGGAPLAPATTRDVTLDDAAAVERRLPGVRRVVPIVLGEALVSWGGRARTGTVIGSARGFLELRRARVDSGTDLPEGELTRDVPVCVIGKTIRRELFGTSNPLGQRIKVGEQRYRVVGTIEPIGMSMMLDLDEVVLVPVASAQRGFNRTGLFRMIVQVGAASDLAVAERRLAAILRDRHDGEEDFTILTPGAVASSLGSIVRLVTAGLAGLAAISLVVAGVGVSNVMVVSVVERTGEIGLMKATGASDGQVLLVFLVEAALLSAIGGALGAGVGWGCALVARMLFPSVPFEVPAWAALAAVGSSVVLGLAFGVLPARRAARMEPLDALRRKLA